MTRLFLLCILGMCLSGCVGSKNPSMPLAAGLTQLEAVYAYDGYTMTMRLNAPELVMDADGQLVEAYPLETSFQGVATPYHMTFWLAGDLRIVRIDNVCLQACPAEYGEIHWFARGYWPPWGFALNRLVAMPDPSQESWGVTQKIQSIVSKHDGATTSIRIETREPIYTANPYLSFGFSFRFTHGDEVPDELQSAETAKLTRLVRGPGLQPIAPLRILSPAKTTTNEAGNWYPGSATPLLNGSVSLDEAVAWLMDNEPEFSRQLKDKCLTMVSFDGAMLQSQILGLDATRTTSTLFKAYVQDPGASSEVAWSWDYQEGANPMGLQEPQWSSRGPKSQQILPQPCKTGPVHVPVLHGAIEHIRLAETLPWAAGKKPVLFFAEMNVGESLFRLPGDRPALDLLFSTSFAAPGQSGQLSSVLEAPAYGAYLLFRGETKELEALPGEYGEAGKN